MSGTMWGRDKTVLAGKGQDEAAPGQWQEGPDPQAAPRAGLIGAASPRLTYLVEGGPAVQQPAGAQLEEGERPTASREEDLHDGDGEVTILLASSPARPFGPSSPANSWPEFVEKKEEAFLGTCHPPAEGSGGSGEVFQGESAGPSVASPPPKRGRASSDGSMVWDHFELCPDDPTTAICIRCRAQVSRGKDPKRLSTSGMLKHLRRHHPEAHAPAATTRLSVLSSSSSKAPASRQGALPAQWVWPVSSQLERPKPQLITQAIAEMIALDDQLLQVVGNAGFHRLLRLLAPEYKLPSWTTFSRQVVPSIYQACKEAVSGLLHSAVPDTSVHFTANVWTSGCGPPASLMSLTAHWWGQESEGPPAAGGMTSPAQTAHHRWALLHIEVLDVDHTADELSVAIGHQVEGWLSRHLNLRRGFMVSNGGQNLVRAAEQLQFVSIPCVVHTLNLVVHEALSLPGATTRQDAAGEGAARPRPDPAIAALVGKCRRIAAYFHRSEKGRRMLKERQMELGLAEHPIPQDAPACWNSTFLLLQRLLEQELAIYCLARRYGLEVCDLSTQDWALISEVVLTLEPFFVATNSLCAETATLSQALPTALLLEKTMGEFQSVLTTEEAAALAARLRTAVVEQLRDPLGRSAEHVLSCLCDPRMKGKAVTPDQLPRWRALLVEEVRQVQERRLGCKQEEGAGPPPSCGPSNPCSSTAVLPSHPGSTLPLTTPTPTPRELLVLPMHSARWFTEGFLGALPGVREEPTEPCSSAERCVLQYLQEPVAGWEMEPIQFWAAHHQVWPDLAMVAERFLSCPPSSVQKERVFSVAADSATPHSLRLETELVEQLVFLKANLPLLGYPDLALESGE